MPSVDPVLFSLGCLGGGGLLISFGILIPPSRRLPALILHVGLALLALLSLGAAALLRSGGHDAVYWAAPLGVAAVHGVGVVLPCVPFVWLCRRAGGRRGRLAGMLAVWIACPFAGLWLAYADLGPITELSNADLDLLSESDARHLKLEPVADSPLTTDQGKAVVLMRLVGQDEAHAAGVEAAQDRVIVNGGLQGEAIRVPVGWQACNCHGFVFAAGRYWLPGSEVDPILRDNGYLPVSQPRPGDVAVYRDAGGGVTHTALVRGSVDGGAALVESKWGKLGRFLHRHDRSPYQADACVFYRSARPGHLLRGISPGEGATPPAVSERPRPRA